MTRKYYASYVLVRTAFTPDKFVHRWKADRQVGHPVILAGPAQMIGRAFYSTTASTDDIY